MVYVDKEKTVFQGSSELLISEILIAFFNIKKYYRELKDFEDLDYINRVLWESSHVDTIEELLENLKKYEDFKKGYSKKQ